MYVRDAKNRDEVWLLDRIEEMGLDETAFRSRDYVIAVDERSNDRAGFGRIRLHKSDDGDVCELTSIGVLESWRDQGIGAHVVERLVQEASDQDFETVYSLTDEPNFLVQFGFGPLDAEDLPPSLQDRLETKRETIDADVVPVELAIEEFTMPEHLRESFKSAAENDGPDEPEESAEDFGIDPDEATYKYDTSR
ncbi:amino-acid N-acetyltransferase protein [Halorhabdus tiamatea SARL4B]|uniref:Amino-acid N-acetyltransferase protein n=1 Tax=Halorhabdus tiamatea SARL4B TaxID=1033806 RepID=F7PFH9_9EURY|nr:GNAT family N-acetyltransferase [Halorhabdus tiamatea]ERJ06475.1 amino-acid N-acetyltransferase protein [Halorhabdus tiamatea SARL4B]CCQ34360.1 GCN5-related N-acetyltransferase [Halorhabdus tiamatea SARL4B]